MKRLTLEQILALYPNALIFNMLDICLRQDRHALRNIAKLLMNSMYGRFGMHADPQMSLIVTLDRALEICGLFEVLSHIIIGGLELLPLQIIQL
jgi:hypothetical protein